MKHLKKILTMFITIVILCSASVGVHGEGVVFRNSDFFYGDPHYVTLNEWLINTPYWAVDVFAPGYSTRHLKNDPSGNDKTIDFEITPYKGFKSTVIVSDIPEEYRNVYNEFINGRKTVPEAKVEVANMVKRNGKLTFDYSAYIQLDVQYVRYEYVTDYSVILYSVTSDKQTGEIIRYDYVDCLVFFNAVKTHCTSVPENIDDDYKYDPNKMYRAEEVYPEDFDHEKHEYGFCLIAFTEHDSLSATYKGEICMYNYTKVDVPTEESPEPEPEPEPIPNPTPKYEYGDANRDGKISITDVSLMLKYVAGWDFIEIDTKLCDMNNNRRIDLHDVSTTLKIIAGWNV